MILVKNMANDNSANQPITFSIHQPNYIPWIGYFYKIQKSDFFVFLDTVQYPRGQSFAARNRIKTPNGPVYLTIPVSIPHGKSGKAGYHEISFADEKWIKKHLKTVEMSYKKSPYFDQIYPILSRQLEKHSSLVDLNINLINEFCSYLNINSKCLRLSKILSNYGKKTELIIDIAKEINGGIYLSGTGGGYDYNDQQLLSENNIILRYSDFKHPVYPQLWGDFEPNLSILDLLFNCGPESPKILIS
jgi:hypothetical protein